MPFDPGAGKVLGLSLIDIPIVLTILAFYGLIVVALVRFVRGLMRGLRSDES